MFYLHNSQEQRHHSVKGCSGGGPVNKHPYNGGGGPLKEQARLDTACWESAGAGTARPASGGYRCPAEESPDASAASYGTDEGDEADISDEVPPPKFLVEPVAEHESASPHLLIHQPAVSRNTLHLLVGECKDHGADVALDAFTVQHNSAQAIVADLLS